MKKLKLSIIVNTFITIFTIYSISLFFTRVDNSNMQVSGFTCFRYFTIDSNVLLMLSSIVMIICSIKSLKNNAVVPKLAIIFKYIGVSAVMVTFLTVLLFLGPTQGYSAMYSGTGLYMHAINPLLALFSLFLFENNNSINKRDVLISVLPTLIYGLLYLVMVVFLSKWNDFYGFNRNNNWYISFVMMIFASYVISYILYKLQNVNRKKL